VLPDDGCHAPTRVQKGRDRIKGRVYEGLAGFKGHWMPSSKLAAVTSGDYVDQLTAIRGLACLVVLFGHVVQVVSYAPFHGGVFATSAYYTVTDALNAEGAVLLFFVLSGCVLSLSLASIPAFNRRNLFAFYIKRVCRLYPLLWLATLIAMISVVAAQPIAGAGVFVPWLTHNLESPVTPAHTIGSLAGVWTKYDGPLWSLRVELIYSALFPFIYMLMRRPKLRGWVLVPLLVLACLPLQNPQYGLAYGFSFAIGALIPLLSKHASKPHALIASLALIVLLYDRAQPVSGHIPDAVHNVVETIASYVIVRYVFVSGSNFRLLSAPPVQWIGERSFSVYLLHLPVFLMIFVAAQCAIGAPPILRHPAWSDTVLGAATCAVTIALSTLTYRYVERPSHQAGRRFAARLTRVGAAPEHACSGELPLTGTSAL